MSKCILVCAGSFEPVEIEIEEGDLCIAVDGGYSHCEMLGILPDLIVGDFDSLSQAAKERVQEIADQDRERIVALPREKDDTDTLYALRLGLQRGYRKFYLYGALGGRLDHTLANISCLLFLKNQGAKGYIMELSQILTVLQNESTKFHKNMTGRLSIFSMGEAAKGVSIQGMKYNLDHAEVRNDFPIGISNEFIGEEASITVEDGSILLNIVWDETV